MSAPTYRIFISSPSDVRPERALAERVIAKLGREFQHHCRLEAIRWEREPLRATEGFQVQIPEPSRSDIVLVILWSRLGTPLAGREWLGPLSGAPVTGTEWEFETALKSARERGLPDLLVFRKKADVAASLDPDDPDRAEQEVQRAELRRLQAFIKQWLRTEEGGLIASTSFRTRTEFEEKLEDQLRGLVRQRLGAVLPQARWHDRPFRGLEVFEAAHAPIFFGRRRATNELVELLGRRAGEGTAFVLVMGASGSGKSSLVRAGLVPDLSLPGMVGRVALVLPAVFRPGAAPLAALSGAILQALPELGGLQYDQAALADQLVSSPKQVVFALKQGLSVAAKSQQLTELGEARLLLVVDQLEELFTQGAVGARERQAFVAALEALATSGLVWVIVTLRSDFFDRLEREPLLAALSSNEGRYLLLPPSDGELGQIIEGPVREAGLRFEVDAAGLSLAEEIRRAAARQANSLPLLEYLLDQLFDRRTAEGVLTFQAYEELGGLEGAIGRRAEQVLAGLPAEDQTALPEVVRRLVAVSEAGMATSRPAALADFREGSPARRLVEALLAPDARLLVADEGQGQAQVRVAHEALLTHWDRMAKQIVTDRKDLQLRGRLEVQAARWREAGEQADLLLNPGLPLSEAEDLLARRRDELGVDLQRYVEGSTRQAQQQASRRLRRARMVAAVLAILAVVAVGFGWYGLDRQSEAERQRAAAEEATQEAERQRTAAETNATEADAQATAAIRNETISFDAISELATATGAPADAVMLALAAWPRPGDSERPQLKRTLSALGAALPQHRERLRLLGHRDLVTMAVFSPSVDRVVTASWDGTARIWDAATGAELAQLEGHLFEVNYAAFSPTGDRVVTASDGIARIWDAATGAELSQLEGHGGRINCATFSPSGDRVVTASDDGTARIWDAATGAELAHMEGHGDQVVFAAFSPSGDRVVTASADGTARTWDVASGAELARLKGHGDRVNSAAFSPSGDRVVTASWDGTARLWDAASGAELARLKGHGDWVVFAAFSPSGDRVVTASADGTARIWDAAPSGKLARLEGHGDRVNAAVFSPSGDRVVTASADGTARIWDAATGAELAHLGGHQGWVRSAAFSPSGDRVVTASDDGTARIWDAASGSELARLEVALGGDPVISAAFSPSGDLVVTVSRDGPARIWDATSGAELALLEEHEGWVTSAAFSPSGDRVVTASDDGTVRLWDTASGSEVARLEGLGDWVISAAFSPLGDRVVTVSFQGPVRLWDAATSAELARLEGHGDRVNSAAFSPSGDRVVTASDDGTARIWDAATGVGLARLEGHGDQVSSAAFSPSGNRVVTASDDSTARIWDVSDIEDGDAFQIACARLGNITDVTDLAARYGLGEIKPICVDHSPEPVDLQHLQ